MSSSLTGIAAQPMSQAPSKDWTSIALRVTLVVAAVALCVFGGVGTLTAAGLMGTTFLFTSLSISGPLMLGAGIVCALAAKALWGKSPAQAAAALEQQANSSLTEAEVDHLFKELVEMNNTVSSSVPYDPKALEKNVARLLELVPLVKRCTNLLSAEQGKVVRAADGEQPLDANRLVKAASDEEIQTLLAQKRKDLPTLKAAYTNLFARRQLSTMMVTLIEQEKARAPACKAPGKQREVSVTASLQKAFEGDLNLLLARLDRSADDLAQELKKKIETAEQLLNKLEDVRTRYHRSQAGEKHLRDFSWLVEAQNG